MARRLKVGPAVVAGGQHAADLPLLRLLHLCARPVGRPVQYRRDQPECNGAFVLLGVALVRCYSSMSSAGHVGSAIRVSSLMTRPADYMTEL